MSKIFTAAARIQSLEALSERRSPIHSLHPLIKLLLTVGYLVAVVSCPPYEVSRLIPFFLYPVLFMGLSGLPYRPLGYRLLAALPFSLIGGLSNVFLNRQVAFYAGSIPISFGLLSFAVILLKTLLAVLAVLILIGTTPMFDLYGQLLRLKLPPVFVLVLMLTYRYIAVLLDEAGSMYVAYALRNPEQKGIQMKDMGVFLGSLLLRAMDRAERVYAAMQCRGFSMAGFFLEDEGPRREEWLLGGIIGGVLLVLRLVNVSVLLGNLMV